MRRTVRSAGRPEHEILGQILRERRIAAGFTQKELGARLDRTQAYIWKIETGIQHVDLPTLFDLAQITKSEPSELVREVELRLSNP